jgi:hypothetical protein
VGFKNAHVEGVELYHMGQQSLGNYPIHFHRNYDVDEVGGYARPAYARQLSIHHCFSRCVTVHSTFGLTVSAFHLNHQHHHHFLLHFHHHYYYLQRTVNNNDTYKLVWYY